MPACCGFAQKSVAGAKIARGHRPRLQLSYSKLYARSMTAHNSIGSPTSFCAKPPPNWVSSMSKRRFLFSVLAGLCGVAVVVTLTRPALSQHDDLDVLKVIPENYRLILDNPFVRVIEARIPPGTVEPPHRHMRGVSVCMTEYTIEARALPDGQWVRSERKQGVVYWSEASLHQVRNVGKTPSHTIRIELKY